MSLGGERRQGILGDLNFKAELGPLLPMGWEPGLPSPTLLTPWLVRGDKYSGVLAAGPSRDQRRGSLGQVRLCSPCSQAVCAGQ